MTTDRQYRNLDVELNEIEHEYGGEIHIMKDAMALTRLARLCSPEVGQPTFNLLIGELYEQLLWSVINAEFPRRQTSIPSRMRESTERGVYRGEIIDPETSVVTVDIARAGIVPSGTCYRRLNELLKPARIRQDHLFMSRVTDADGNVTGAEILGDKVGGAIDDAFVLLPDPMGATGSSMSGAIDYYKREVSGEARRIVTMNLIVTPEFVRRMREKHPDVACYAFRLDRGTSPNEVLEMVPGREWDRESGLDDDDYIVPGGGGFGELMNNSWV